MHTLLLFLAPFLSADLEHAANRDELSLPAPAELALGGLVLRLEETRLVAESRSLEPFVLVFSGPGHTHLTARTVRPGATLIAQHAPHARVGVWLEVLSAQNGRLASSGTLALDDRSGLLVFERFDGLAPSALGGEGELRRGPSLLPLPEMSVPSAPLHVPIPSPDESSRGNTPPPVEKEPLPPV